MIPLRQWIVYLKSAISPVAQGQIINIWVGREPFWLDREPSGLWIVFPKFRCSRRGCHTVPILPSPQVGHDQYRVNSVRKSIGETFGGIGKNDKYHCLMEKKHGLRYISPFHKTISFLESQWLNVGYWSCTHNPVRVDLKSMKVVRVQYKRMTRHIVAFDVREIGGLLKPRNLPIKVLQPAIDVRITV